MAPAVVFLFCGDTKKVLMSKGARNHAIMQAIVFLIMMAIMFGWNKKGDFVNYQKLDFWIFIGTGALIVGVTNYLGWVYFERKKADKQLS